MKNDNLENLILTSEKAQKIIEDIIFKIEGLIVEKNQLKQDIKKLDEEIAKEVIQLRTFEKELEEGK